MPALVLTKDSWLACDHRVLPGAGVTPVGLPAKLTVAGAPVLLAGDVTAATVAGCPVAPSNSTKKCTATVAHTAGEATKLRVGGVPVLTADTAGDVDGYTAAPPPPHHFKVTDPRQNLLRTE